MSCFNAERVYRYLDNDLDRAGREEFERHLGLCPACRRAVDERRLIAQAAAGLPPLELPPGFSRRVMARLEDRPRVSVFGWLALGSTAFVSLVAVVVGVFVLSGRSLTELVTGFEGFMVNTFKSGAILFGKATSLVSLVLSVVNHILSALWGGLAGLTAVIPWPVWVFSLAFLLIIIATSIYGLRKILVGVHS
jgi:anti-sigma factor RsiW